MQMKHEPQTQTQTQNDNATPILPEEKGEQQLITYKNALESFSVMRATMLQTLLQSLSQAGLGYGVNQDSTVFILPQDMTEIGDEAFKDRTTLTHIVLPPGITKIGRYAFAGCTALTQVTLNQGIKEIGFCAFHGCHVLAQINLPESLTEILSNAFESCRALTQITLPQGITVIRFGVFAGCTALTQISLSKGLTVIGRVAFAGCSALTHMHLPQGLIEIEHGAFRDCIALIQINLPQGLTTIGDFVFDNCKALIEVYIPNGITTLRDGTFRDCHALAKITLPQSITKLTFPFIRCNNLQRIIIDGDDIRPIYRLLRAYKQQVKQTHIDWLLHTKEVLMTTFNAPVIIEKFSAVHHVNIGFFKESNALIKPPRTKLITTQNNNKVIDNQSNSLFFKIITGPGHTLFLTPKNKLFSCGNNSFGQLGINSKEDKKNVFTEVHLSGLLQPDEMITQGAAGDSHTLLLTSKSRLLVCGNNYQGQLGITESYGSLKQFTLCPLDNVLKKQEGIKHIATAASHTILLTTDNRVLVCGQNDDGQLGVALRCKIRSFSEVCLTQILDPGERVQHVTAGRYCSVFLTSHNAILVSSSEYYGQLGLDKKDRYMQGFTKLHLHFLNPLETVTQLVLGQSYSLLLTSHHRVFICGQNGYKESVRGPGITEKFTFNECILKDLLEEEHISSITGTGCKHPLLQTNKGRVFVSGHKGFEELHCEEDIAVLGIGGLFSDFIVALTSEGNLLSKGCNTYGQLGLGIKSKKPQFYFQPIAPFYPKGLEEDSSGQDEKQTTSLHL